MDCFLQSYFGEVYINLIANNADNNALSLTLVWIIKAYLEDLELWECVEPTTTEGVIAAVDPKKDKKCRAKIILLIDSVNYAHIQSTTISKEAWDKLAEAFSDNGLTRRVGLLRILITTRLESCRSVEEYVNTIVTTAFKLSSIGLNVSDEWVGTILLAGLPEHFQPMLMGIESSGVAVTADAIKNKLLQDVSVEQTEKIGREKLCNVRLWSEEQRTLCSEPKRFEQFRQVAERSEKRGRVAITVIDMDISHVTVTRTGAVIRLRTVTKTGTVIRMQTNQRQKMTDLSLPRFLCNQRKLLNGFGLRCFNSSNSVQQVGKH
ncbi:hypothetical protein NQ318_021767 [Aromia moschata]|uniref:Uncharacterized protein n=1 Tax=Aromia moschata TaxID=1265417 RepID=A0AAV8Z6P6_9CUCU|nr:hypothetical protein NQ318_021767 [Aromia moschata]